VEGREWREREISGASVILGLYPLNSWRNVLLKGPVTWWEKCRGRPCSLIYTCFSQNLNGAERGGNGVGIKFPIWGGREVGKKGKEREFILPGLGGAGNDCSTRTLMGCCLGARLSFYVTGGVSDHTWKRAYGPPDTPPIDSSLGVHRSKTGMKRVFRSWGLAETGENSVELPFSDEWMKLWKVPSPRNLPGRAGMGQVRIFFFQLGV